MLLINKQKIEIITKRLKRDFKEIYLDRLSQLILFGSQARGDAQPDSDIDILVVLKGEVNPVDEINRNSYFISELCLEFDALINCFYLSELQFKEGNKPLIKNIRKEGIIL
ncbi:nucleotidyltransferase domain-containing protein [Geminocystis sp. CENA526]|uniref:nucleotidyltransferase domain-containing protein n=1 Tax=Geminocystis sp. CENA526 TaxID=1355871 RepID=UPI003D6EF58D